MLGIKSEPDSELASAAVDLRGLYRERCGLDSAPWGTFDTAGGNLGVILSCARLTDLHLLAGHLSDSGYAQRYISETMLLILLVQFSCDQRQVTIDDLIAVIETCDAILCATQDAVHSGASISNCGNQNQSVGPENFLWYHYSLIFRPVLTL